MDSEKRDKTVETENKPDVPFVAYERAEAAFERNIKRLWITVSVLIALLFASNMLWLWAFTGYDMVSYDYEQGDSGINIIGDDNSEVTYNGSKAENTQDDKTQRLSGEDNQNKS